MRTRTPSRSGPSLEVQKSQTPAPLVKQAAPELPAPGPLPVLPAKSAGDMARGFRSALRDRMYFDMEADGTVWVRGRSYKASFGHDGTTYIPLLGPCAPRNYPVHAVVDTITAGDRSVGFDAFAPPNRDGMRVTYDRGGVVETYDLTLDSVEQSFVFARLPDSGDLVVRLAVQSELSRAERDEGFEFSNERGAVRYSRAQSHDAAGVGLVTTTTLTPEGIEIRVPADEVARARFPLTIDPVISTFDIDTTTQDDYVPDVAYDPGTNRYYACEEATVSATDHDVIAFEIDATGAVIGVGVCIDCTGAFWQTPKIANTAFISQFLVVAAVGVPGGGPRTIWGRKIGAASFSIGASFQVSPTDQSGDKLNPDVGGDDYLGGEPFYMVVWTRIYSSNDFDVHAARVSGYFNTVSPTTILIDNSGGTADTVPHISKLSSDGPEERWLVVWNRDAGPSDRDIYAAELHWLSTIEIPSTPIATGVQDDIYPRVSSPLEEGYDPLHYLIVYERVTGASTHDVMGALVSAQSFPVGMTVLDSKDLSTTFESAYSAEDQIHPTVDSDGRHFEVTYSEQYSTSPTDYDIYASDYGMSGDAIVAAEVHQNLAFTGSAESNPSIASNHVFSGGGPRSMVVWDRSAATGNHNTHGGLYASVLGGPVSTFCSGDGSGTGCPCGNSGAAGHGCANSVNPSGAQLAATGIASVSADSLVLTGSGQPATAAGLFFQGTASLGGGAPFGDGLHCVGGMVIRLGPKTASGGSSHYPAGGDPSISVHGAVPSVGGTRFYQLWYRNAGPSFCTSAVFNLTNGVQVSWTL